MRSWQKPGVYLMLASMIYQLVPPQRAGAEHPLGRFTRLVTETYHGKEPPTCADGAIEDLAEYIDWLEHHVDKYGSVVTKQPDVWGESRWTRHRFEYEKVLANELWRFEPKLQAAIRRSDQAFLGMALSLQAAATGDSAPVPTTGGLDAAGKPTANSFAEVNLTMSDPFLPVAGAGSVPAGAPAIVRTAPFAELTGAKYAFPDPTLSIEPTVELDQLSRYINHLHELRRINEGDDIGDAPGYALNLVRIPVSILPGKMTQTGFGAEVTIIAEPYLGPDLLPTTFRTMVINDLVDLLAPVVTHWANQPIVLRVTNATSATDHQSFAPAAAMESEEVGGATNLPPSELESLSYAEVTQAWRDAAATTESGEADNVDANSDNREENIAKRNAAIAFVNNNIVSQNVPNTSASVLNNRRSRTPIPLSQVVEVIGERELKELVAKIRETIGQEPTSSPHIHYMDVRNFLRAELEAAYDFLVTSENATLWEQHCTPQLATVIHGRRMTSVELLRASFYCELGQEKLYPKSPCKPVAAPERAFESTIQPDPIIDAPTIPSAPQADPSVPDLPSEPGPVIELNPVTPPESPRPSADPFGVIQPNHADLSSNYISLESIALASTFNEASPVAEKLPKLELIATPEAEISRAIPTAPSIPCNPDQQFARLYELPPCDDCARVTDGKPMCQTVTGILAWSIMVEAALLDERLHDDIRETAGLKGAPLPADVCVPFFGPNPPPEARDIFNEYVRHRWPIHVFALDPVNQEQNVADEFSRRRELQVALSLAFAADQIGAQALMRHARRLEWDMATIALNRTAVGFSHGSDTFGWRFFPRFQSPPTSSGVEALCETMLGGPSREKDLNSRQIEPGMRECTAIVIMPSFVPYATFDVRTNWFKLANPKNAALTVKDTMKLSRAVTAMRNGRALYAQCEHCYREGEVRRLLRRVDQLDRELPLQTMQVQIPYENTAGGFEVFNSGVTELAPELIGFYGEPGINPNGMTEMFLVGDGFSVHDTRVIAGNREVEFELISRQLMRVQLPGPLLTLKENNMHAPGDDADHRVVDVHIATPYGVSSHLMIPVAPLGQATQPAAAPLDIAFANNSILRYAYKTTLTNTSPPVATLTFAPTRLDNGPISVQMPFATPTPPSVLTVNFSVFDMQGKQLDGAVSVDNLQLNINTGHYEVTAPAFLKLTNTNAGVEKILSDFIKPQLQASMGAFPAVGGTTRYILRGQLQNGVPVGNDIAIEVTRTQ